MTELRKRMTILGSPAAKLFRTRSSFTLTPSPILPVTSASHRINWAPRKSGAINSTCWTRGSSPGRRSCSERQR